MSDLGGRVFVTAVGVTRYADPAVRPVPFASADARTFAEAAPRFSATAPTIRLLTDADATVPAVRAALTDLAAAGKDDAVYLFLAGRAVGGGTVNLTLLGTDTAAAEASAAGLPLSSLLRAVWSGPAKLVVLLFDFGRGEPESAVPTPELLARVFPPQTGRAVLLADAGTHGSHVSGELQAGVWAAHVTAALAGDAPRALDADGTLTAGSLRTFLAEELPRSLARAYTGGREQSPWVLADDAQPLLPSSAIAAAPTDAKPPLAGVLFFSERELPVKGLGGFRKGMHSVPTDTFPSSRAWVGRLAEPDLAQELEATLPRLRQNLGYKRRDVRADGPAAGAASILTPDFAFHLTATQHAERPSFAVLRRTLSEVRTPDVLNAPGFAAAFPAGFHALHCPFETPADIETLIDALEDAEPPTVAQLNYPTDLSRLDLELTNFAGRVRIQPAGLTLTAPAPAPPAELARQFALVKTLLRAAGV